MLYSKLRTSCGQLYLLYNLRAPNLSLVARIRPSFLPLVVPPSTTYELLSVAGKQPNPLPSHNVRLAAQMAGQLRFRLGERAPVDLSVLATVTTPTHNIRNHIT